MDSWVLPSNSQQPIGDDDERFPRDCQGVRVFGAQHHRMPVAQCKPAGPSASDKYSSEPVVPNLITPGI